VRQIERMVDTRNAYKILVWNHKKGKDRMGDVEYVGNEY